MFVMVVQLKFGIAVPGSWPLFSITNPVIVGVGQSWDIGIENLYAKLFAK